MPFRKRGGMRSWSYIKLYFVEWKVKHQSFLVYYWSILYYMVIYYIFVKEQSSYDSNNLAILMLDDNGSVRLLVPHDMWLPRYRWQLILVEAFLRILTLSVTRSRWLEYYGLSDNALDMKEKKGLWDVKLSHFLLLLRTIYQNNAQQSTSSQFLLNFVYIYLIYLMYFVRSTTDSK